MPELLPLHSLPNTKLALSQNASNSFWFPIILYISIVRKNNDHIVKTPAIGLGLLESKDRFKNPLNENYTKVS